MADFASTTEVQMAVMLANFASMTKLFELHTKQDMTQFNKLDETLGAMSEKIDEIQIALAHDAGIREGHEASLKRMAGAISLMVSVGVGAATLLLKHYGS
jgi:hypothetical protein